MSLWPRLLPQCPILNSFAEQRQDNILAFKPDVGPAKSRRKRTASGVNGSFSFRMTADQVDIFNEFFINELQDGARPFDLRHPTDGRVYTWFFDTQAAPRIERITPNTFHVDFNALRFGSGTVPNGPPPQAAAVGYNTNTFNVVFNSSTVDIFNTKAPGFKLYPFTYFGGSVPDPTKMHLMPDGSILLDGDVTGPNSQLATGTDMGGGTFRGMSFGGGGYFECVFKFNPQAVIDNGFNGWPSWWSMSMEHMVGAAGDHWPGQASNYAHFVEFDFVEYLASGYVPSIGTNSWGNVMHDWSGIGNSRNFTIDYPGFIVHLDDMPDLQQYHKYGCLWVPAVGSALGYCRYFFDDVEVGQARGWLAYDSSAAPPATNNVFSVGHDVDDFGFQYQNFRIVIPPASLGTPTTSGNIYLNFQPGFVGSKGQAQLDSVYVGHGTVTGTGGVPGSNLITAAFSGSVGAGNIPTGWNNVGIDNGNSLINPPGGTVNGVTTLADALRTTSAGGYQGIQQNFSFIAGRKYRLSAWVARVTGVTPGWCSALTGGKVLTLASDSTLSGAAADTYIQYTVDFVADGGDTIIGIINSDGVSTHGFNFALPSVQLFTIDPYVVTFDGTKKQVTFNGGSPVMPFWPIQHIQSDPIPFAYDHTKNLIISFYASGTDVELGVKFQSGIKTYHDIDLHTSGAGNAQTNTAANSSASFNQVENNYCPGLQNVWVQKYTEWSIADAQHLSLHIGTSPGMPMTIQSINVWQTDDSHNDHGV